LELLLFRNVKHTCSSALVNLRVYIAFFLIVFLCPVYSVRLCVHLKPEKPKNLKKPKKPKNLHIFLKNLRFLPALVATRYEEHSPINSLTCL